MINLKQELSKNICVIVDEFLKKEKEDEIKNFFSNNQLEWYYSDTSLNEKDNSLDFYEGPQFTHSFIVNSKKTSNFLEKILELTDYSKINLPIIRLKANLKLNVNNSHLGLCNPPHIDFPDEKRDMITAIYYVDDSDGDTFFYDDSYKITNRVSPKKGRFVFFKGDTYHSASHPRVNKKRIVINFNLLNV